MTFWRLSAAFLGSFPIWRILQHVCVERVAKINFEAAHSAINGLSYFVSFKTVGIN
jgi:hypothetical protein